MRIQGDYFSIEYNPETSTITCTGSLEQRGDKGYREISDLLTSVVEQAPPRETVTLDIRKLEFLNSSGITTLARFIIALRNKGEMSLLVRCSKLHTWQTRSIVGLQKLMQDRMEIHYE